LTIDHRVADTLTSLTDALAGRYRLLEQIGRGGMATVYRADDVQHGRTVAMKVLRPDLMLSASETGRFLREIRIASRLSHPGILPLFDSGEVVVGHQSSVVGGLGAADDRRLTTLLFFTMPFVAGESLRQRLTREGRLPVDEAVTVGRAVALALDYAHRQNVVHRDIKPENILIHEGQPVVADFGIARAITVAASENVTERGLAIGTPAYMSPEQISAERELDGRCDIYALGCVLYELLAGSPPFGGSSHRPVLLQHLSDPVPPIRERRPTVTPTVERALVRALAKAPADRFDTASQFADALTARVTAPVLAMRRERTLAVLPFANTSSEADTEYLSAGITEELINALAIVDGLQVSSRSAVFHLKGERENARALGERLDVQAVLDGSVRRAGERLRIVAQLIDVADGRLLWSERFDRKTGDIFALEEDIARTIVSILRTRFLGDLADPTPRRYTENVNAYNLYLKGRFAWNQRTQAALLEAIRFFEAAIAEDPAYALAYTGLSDSYALQVDYRGAPVTEGMRRAREEAHRALELDDGLAEAHTSLAWVTFIHDWDWEKAGREFARAIELNPRYASARQWHGWYLVAMGRVEEAIAEGHMAEELDPSSIPIHGSLGWLYQYARLWEEPAARLRRSVALNPTNDETVWALGVSLMELGDYDQAERVLRDAEALASANFHAFATLGRLAVKQGKRDDAEARLRQLERIARDRYVSPVDFARLHIGLGNHDAAFEWMERAYEERRGWLAYLKVDPLVDPLRADPRFGEWLRRMGLD
jgi:serine/threonine-protein kinase